MTQHQVLDRATFEREYRACIHEYLHEELPFDEARAVLQRSVALTTSFARVVGIDEAQRISKQVLERVAQVFVPMAKAS